MQLQLIGFDSGMGEERKNLKTMYMASVDNLKLRDKLRMNGETGHS